MTNNILAVSGAAELLIYHMPCFLWSEFVSLVARRKAVVLRAACAWRQSWALVLLRDGRRLTAATSRQRGAGGFFETEARQGDFIS